MDNAIFHKRAEMQSAVDSGHTLLYLPPYFPHLNSIEKKWAQAKSMRQSKNCSISELFKSHII